MKSNDIDLIKNDLIQWMATFSASSDETARVFTESDKYSDPVDMASAQSEMDYILHRMYRKGLNKENVLNALKKIEDGSYGICEECEEEIPIKRLKAIPDARYCISCQAEIEKMVA